MEFVHSLADPVNRIPRTGETVVKELPFTRELLDSHPVIQEALFPADQDPENRDYAAIANFARNILRKIGREVEGELRQRLVFEPAIRRTVGVAQNPETGQLDRVIVMLGIDHEAIQKKA